MQNILILCIVDADISEDSPELQLRALEEKILKTEALDLKRVPKELPKELPRELSKELPKEFLTKIEKIEALTNASKNLTEAELKNPEKERLTQIQMEISEYAKDVQKKVEIIAEKIKASLSETQDVMKLLTEISEYLLKNQPNQSEFGVSAFKNYIDLIQEHQKVTIFELRRSKFIQNLLHFIFDGLVDKKDLQIQKTNLPENATEEEEKLNVFPTQKDTLPSVETRSKPSIEIPDEQSRLIVGRLIAFLDAFKTKSPRDPTCNFLTVDVCESYLAILKPIS